jgi:hypothetical protein
VHMDAAHVTRAARAVMDCMDGQRGDADRTETLAGHAWARSGRGGRPVGMAWPCPVRGLRMGPRGRYPPFSGRHGLVGSDSGFIREILR